PGIPSGGIHGLFKASKRAPAPGLIRAPLGVRRKDQLCARSFQDARRADETVAEIFAVKAGERVVGNRVTITVNRDAAAVAIPQQRPNAHGLRKLAEQQTIVLRVAPRKNSAVDAWLQRGGFVFHAV